MNEDKLEYILLRGPGTDENGNKIAVEVKMAKSSEADLTGYSFLCREEKYEEWVPTKELQIYKMVRGLI